MKNASVRSNCSGTGGEIDHQVRALDGGETRGEIFSQARGPMTPAERKRRSRARQKADDLIAGALVDSGRLAGWDENNRVARRHAVEQLLDDWVAQVTRDVRDPLARVGCSESTEDRSSAAKD